jgi:hypothetical protein
MLPLFGVRWDKAGTALSLLSPISSKNEFFFNPPNISAGSLLKPQKMELILAKLQHKNSREGLNIKFEMTLSPQETR